MNVIKGTLIGICVVIPFFMYSELYLTQKYLNYQIILLVTLTIYYFLHWHKSEKALFKSIREGKFGIGLPVVFLLGIHLFRGFLEHKFQLEKFVLLVIIVLIAFFDFSFKKRGTS
ncbi:MAG: hypothetical protein H6571_02585 [Lewinellaceae bacterium]|nr:hypothetical protein [Lewinellaceae bacterium]